MCRKLTLLMNVIFISFKTNINIVVTNMVNEYQYNIICYLIIYLLSKLHFTFYSFFLLFTCLF